MGRSSTPFVLQFALPICTLMITPLGMRFSLLSLHVLFRGSLVCHSLSFCILIECTNEASFSNGVQFSAPVFLDRRRSARLHCGLPVRNAKCVVQAVSSQFMALHVFR